MLLSDLSTLPHDAPDEEYQAIVEVCSSHVDQLLAGNSFEQKLLYNNSVKNKNTVDKRKSVIF